MGYNTIFSGGLEFDNKVPVSLIKYVNNFSNSRRIKRSNEKIKELYPNWEEFCFNGNLGEEGEYFFYTKDINASGDNSSIYKNVNLKELNDDDEIEAVLLWDGGEKFYDYTEWLKYIIDNFIKYYGLESSGVIYAVGEERGDASIIVVDKNNVQMFNDDKCSTKSLLSKYENNEIICGHLNDKTFNIENLKNSMWQYDDEDEDY